MAQLYRNRLGLSLLGSPPRIARIDDLADEWSTRLHLPRATVHTYLSQNIWYLLDDACLAGLDLFYRYGFECGALPLAPKLRFL